MNKKNSRLVNGFEWKVRVLDEANGDNHDDNRKISKKDKLPSLMVKSFVLLIICYLYLYIMVIIWALSSVYINISFLLLLLQNMIWFFSKNLPIKFLFPKSLNITQFDSKTRWRGCLRSDMASGDECKAHGWVCEPSCRVMLQVRTRRYLFRSQARILKLSGGKATSNSAPPPVIHLDINVLTAWFCVL